VLLAFHSVGLCVIICIDYSWTRRHSADYVQQQTGMYRGSNDSVRRCVYCS